MYLCGRDWSGQSIFIHRWLNPLQRCPLGCCLQKVTNGWRWQQSHMHWDLSITKKNINVESLTHMAYKKCLKKRTLSNKIVWLEIKHWHKHKCENRINWYLHNSVLNSDGHCARICFKIAMVWDFDNNCLTYQWYDDSDCVQMYCFLMDRFRYNLTKH